MSKATFIFLCVLLGITLGFTGGTSDWLTDYSKATELAEKQNKYILLRFSGSDWCGNCIKLERKLFNDSAFLSLAKKSIVLLVADFPKKRKNRLSKELTQQNEQLAEKYNTKGAFPKTVVIDHNGNLIKVMQYPLNTVDEYIANIKTIISAN